MTAAPDLSMAEVLAQREDWRELYARLAPTEDDALALEHDWKFWSRPKQQVPPGDWFTWLIQAGRGFGKTRTGAETVNLWAHDFSPIAIVGSTAADVRDVMVELGESSIQKCAPPWWRPRYEPSKRRLTWPNGAVGICYGADEADTLRGPQHAKGWADELAKWKRLKEAWDNLVFGMRLGAKPQIVVTTTPKPKKKLRELAKKKNTHVTRGSMFENARNLAPVFLEEILAAYGGTRTGRQEIEGELLEDVEGTLFPRERIDSGRVKRAPESLLRVVVGVDPAASSGPDSNDTGIVVAGKDTRKPAHLYVLADRTCHLAPSGWAAAAINAYQEFGADAIVAEVNNGGEMVEAVIRNAPGGREVRVKVVHASRGKVIRAEPLSLIYEQGRAHHVGETDELDDQLATFTDESADVAQRARDSEDAGGGSDSPDRVDALVWAATELLAGKSWGAAA